MERVKSADPNQVSIKVSFKDGRTDWIAIAPNNADLSAGEHKGKGMALCVRSHAGKTTAARQRPVGERLRKLRDYRWSSYRAYAGMEKMPSWLITGPILAFYSGGLKEQRRKYRQFVEGVFDKEEGEDQSAFRSSTLAIGGDEFVDWIRGKLIERACEAKCASDIALRRQAEAVPVENVLNVAARILGVEPSAFEQRRRNSDLRGVAAYALCRFAGLTQRDAAEVLGIKTGAAVGQQLQRLRRRLLADSHLRERLARIEEALCASR